MSSSPVSNVISFDLTIEYVKRPEGFLRDAVTSVQPSGRCAIIKDTEFFCSPCLSLLSALYSLIYSGSPVAGGMINKPEVLSH